MRYNRDELLTQMWDLLVSRPGGVTIHEIAAALRTTRYYADGIVRSFRLLFGDTDSINLVCAPNGSRQPWLYSLAGTYDGSSTWTGNRIGDAESRFETIIAIVRSIVTATDGRTIEGKRARIMLRALTRAQEDLADLTA